MLKCALQNLICYEEDINKINVFPVSDGDTGTNMRFTLESSINSTPSSENLGEYLKNLSKEMLFGARGNSGVILSQIFKGFYISLQEKKCANSEDLAKAFLEGARTARILAGLLAVAMLFGSAVTVFQAFFAGKNNGSSTASNFNYSEGLDKNGFMKDGDKTIKALDIVTLPDYNSYEISDDLKSATDEELQTQLDTIKKN